MITAQTLIFKYITRATCNAFGKFYGMVRQRGRKSQFELKRKNMIVFCQICENNLLAKITMFTSYQLNLI